jgi:hypothetical protein
MKAKQTSPNLRNLNLLAKWMDARFRIPGTSIRFGFDAILGLIPGVGDLVSFLISGYLLSEASRKGASGFVMARMMLNIGIDFVVGAIPLVGDIFDVTFRANQRNMRLLQQHYNEGRHRGSASKVIVPIVILMLTLFAGFVWLCYKIIVWLF